jgi:hypothetical protein
MKLTYPKWADVTPASITLEGEPSADGSPVVLLEWNGLVNFSEKAKRIQDKDGRWVQLSGVIHVEGDILGDVPFIRGTCTIDGLATRSIVSISRPRNPDGSINHTRLELI